MEEWVMSELAALNNDIAILDDGRTYRLVGKSWEQCDNLPIHRFEPITENGDSKDIIDRPFLRRTVSF
jgi:hypothetical protein